nr:MAG TPA: hypothetical protein [Bacteriophage sp.]
MLSFGEMHTQHSPQFRNIQPRLIEFMPQVAMIRGIRHHAPPISFV